MADNKKGSSHYLFTMLVFIGFLVLFSSGLFINTVKVTQPSSNQSNNGTIIYNDGLQQLAVPTCNGGILDNIFLLGQASCIAAYLGFYWSLISIKISVDWLLPLFIGLGGVLGFKLIKVLRGV